MIAVTYSIGVASMQDYKHLPKWSDLVLSKKLQFFRFPEFYLDLIFIPFKIKRGNSAAT